MKLSCAFSTSLEAPRLARVAEELGYEHAWFYDSPALYTDVWMAMGMAAQQTSRIGIGPAVLVPSLRHPMVTAAAIATLYALAPNRVSVALGSGFSGRYTLGQKPMKWADVENYIATLKGLLRGETVEWEGAPIRMLHGESYGAQRPIDIEMLIGAEGPKGTSVAARVGDGLVSAGKFNEEAPAGRPHATMQFGTVLDEDEDIRSPRVLDAAGHALAVMLHLLYEKGGVAGASTIPGGEEWAKVIESYEPHTRHLTTHEGHLVRLAPFEQKAIEAAADMIPQICFTGTKAQLRERATVLEEKGVTEIIYQPAGGDIEGELKRMAEVFQI